MRFKVELALDMDPEEIKKRVLSDARAEKWLAGKTLRKFIFVPKKIINIAVS